MYEPLDQPTGDARREGVRIELAGQDTLVAALVPGLVATDTMREFARNAGIDLPEEAMIEPVDLVRLALDGLEAGEVEILDRIGAEAKASLTGPPRAFDLAEVARG